MSEFTAGIDVAETPSAQVLPNEGSNSPSGELPALSPLDVREAQERMGGRFQPGNTAALKHGLRSQRPLSPSAATYVQERVSAIIADRGGPEALSTIELGQIQRHARLELAEDHLWTDLETSGLSTGKGATRARSTLWLAVVDRLQKSAQMLGLQRTPKRLDTVADLVERS